jgi:hypothetical protein
MADEEIKSSLPSFGGSLCFWSAFPAPTGRPRHKTPSPTTNHPAITRTLRRGTATLGSLRACMPCPNKGRQLRM